MTHAELDQVGIGFDEHGLAHGVPPHTQIRYGFVALEDDQFVGGISGLTNHNWFHITDLWAEEAYRGRRIGTGLIEKLEARIRAAGFRKIFTWTASYEAPPFYEKRGYKVFCELENYYATGDSRVGLRKTIS